MIAGTKTATVRNLGPAFATVPAGDKWGENGGFKFVLSTFKYARLFGTDASREQLGLLRRQGLGAVIEAVTYTDSGTIVMGTRLDTVRLTGEEAVGLLNYMYSSMVRFCEPDGLDELKERMTTLVEKYCGQSIDALAILVEGYRLGLEKPIFDKLVGWDGIDVLHEASRASVSELAPALAAHGFLSSIMKAGVSASLGHRG